MGSLGESQHPAHDRRGCSDRRAGVQHRNSQARLSQAASSALARMGTYTPLRSLKCSIAMSWGITVAWISGENQQLPLVTV